MNITELLNQPESKTLEFKRDPSSMKSILKTIVAFANTAGGTLIIGRDRDGVVRGIDDVLAAEERLANSIDDTIRPPMMPEIEVVTVDGKELLVVQVAHWRGPFYLKSEGDADGVYLRLGSTTRRAAPDMLAELRRSLADVSYDMTPVPEVDESGLDREAIERTLGSLGRKINTKSLQTLGVLVSFADRLVASQGGVILFGGELERLRYAPDARLSAARFRGPDKVVFIDRQEFEGPILDAIDWTEKFIARNTRLGARIRGMRREDIPEYPTVAVREVLVNALVHSDYSLSGLHTRVAIYSDRLEIESPGMLPFGMTLEHFKSGVSRPRNKVLARVFRELELIEEWGSGYRRIGDACREGGYPEPEWEELGMVMRVAFRPHPEVAGYSATDGTITETMKREGIEPNERQRWFLEELLRGRPATAEDICAQWNVGLRTARRDIAQLADAGAIHRVGSRKSGHYELRSGS